MTASVLGPLFEARPTGWEEKAPGRCAALRALLSDCAWHSMSELQAIAGWRYGARLFEAARGKDGGPGFDYEKERRGGGFFYRMKKVGP